MEDNNKLFDNSRRALYVSRDLHKRFKELAVRREVKIQDLSDEALRAFLASAEASTP